ncbi:hypothetical protein BH18ACI3_BH18ACI3_03920 [soil metagenome]
MHSDYHNEKLKMKKGESLVTTNFRLGKYCDLICGGQCLSLERDLGIL